MPDPGRWAPSKSKLSIWMLESSSSCTLATLETTTGNECAIPSQFSRLHPTRSFERDTAKALAEWIVPAQDVPKADEAPRRRRCPPSQVSMNPAGSTGGGNSFQAESLPSTKMDSRPADPSPSIVTITWCGEAKKTSASIWVGPTTATWSVFSQSGRPAWTPQRVSATKNGPLCRSWKLKGAQPSEHEDPPAAVPLPPSAGGGGSKSADPTAKIASSLPQSWRASSSKLSQSSKDKPVAFVTKRSLKSAEAFFVECITGGAATPAHPPGSVTPLPRSLSPTLWGQSTTGLGSSLASSDPGPLHAVRLPIEPRPWHAHTPRRDRHSS